MKNTNHIKFKSWHEAFVYSHWEWVTFYSNNSTTSLLEYYSSRSKRYYMTAQLYSCFKKLVLPNSGSTSISKKGIMSKRLHSCRNTWELLYLCWRTFTWSCTWVVFALPQPENKPISGLFSLLQQRESNSPTIVLPAFPPELVYIRLCALSGRGRKTQLAQVKGCVMSLSKGQSKPFYAQGGRLKTEFALKVVRLWNWCLLFICVRFSLAKVYCS